MEQKQPYKLENIFSLSTLMCTIGLLDLSLDASALCDTPCRLSFFFRTAVPQERSQALAGSLYRCWNCFPTTVIPTHSLCSLHTS